MSYNQKIVIQIIGIDCATIDKKVGLALASYQGETTVVQQIALGAEAGSAVERITDWIDGHRPTLLALDAPLGWPSHLGQTLNQHKAGLPIKVPPNLLFRRTTDRIVREKIGRLPLDVGADRIARTAHSALRLIQALRTRTGTDIQLSWRPDDFQSIGAIEVYPAATLTVYSIRAKGYKKKSQRVARQSMIEQLDVYLQLPKEREILISNADALDAVICVLAGVDYLRGASLRPPDRDEIRKEGWIWVRAPSSEI